MSAHVFLSHSTGDKPIVEELARRLHDKEGIQVWLDRWNLVPGAPWQPAIETALQESESCAVFVGREGLGPWQTEEMRLAINRRVCDRQQRFRVIPVLLPGAKRDSLPALLVDTMGVEFRSSIDDSDAFQRLVCGIRGVASGPGGPDTRGSPRTTHNLPFAPNPVFTGREADLESLGERLEKRGEVALTQTVALHGLGGVGKTQLAVEYAWKHLGGYETVLWVMADSPETFEANLAGLAHALGLLEASAKEQSVQMDAVLGWLKGHERWLLIADNADTDEAARAVRDRLAPNLGGHVLVTSRLGHWPVNMPHLPLNVLSREDAVRYLLDRVAKEGHNAGDEAAARSLSHELGHLPLALEQAAAFIIEVHWSFDKYREHFGKARPELLSYDVEGATRYANSVAKTWSVSLERLSPLSRALLRLTAWFATEAIPRGIFTADKAFLSKALGTMISKGALGGTRGWTSYFREFFWRLGKVDVSNLAVDQALAELDRFSLIRLTRETASVHRLLQAVEQDALSPDERGRWLICAVWLFNSLAPKGPNDTRHWDVWVSLSPHAEMLLEHANRQGIDSLPISVMAHQLGTFLYARGSYAQAEHLYEQALAISEKALGPEHPTVAEGLNNMAVLYHAQGQYAKAEPFHQRALAIWEKALGPDHRDVAASLNNLAGLYNAQGHYAKAEPLHERALAIWEKALGPEHPNVAACLNNLAVLYKDQGHYAKAEPLHERALAISEKALGPEHPDVAACLNYQALLFVAEGQYAKAEPLYERALAIWEKALGPDHAKVAASLHNLAGLYNTQGHFAKAERLYERALAIWEKALGPEHPHVATSLHDLAGLYNDQGHYAKAEPLHQRALAISEKALGPEHPDVAACLNNLAGLYDDQGHHAKAEPLHQRALAIWKKALGPEHPNVAVSLNRLAEPYRLHGQYVKAEPFYRQALAIREKALRPEHPDVAISLNNLAGLYVAQGYYAKAEPLFEKVLAIRETALGPEHPTVAKSLDNLAGLYDAEGQHAKAEALHQRALVIFERALGPEHPDVAISLNNLAVLYYKQKQYGKAEPLQRRAISIWEKALGPESPKVVTSLGNYASLLRAMGRYQEAEPLEARAKAIRAKSA